MMSGEAWLFLLSVLINAVNLFLQVFFTIMYSDLEWYVAAIGRNWPWRARPGNCLPSHPECSLSPDPS